MIHQKRMSNPPKGAPLCQTNQTTESFADLTASNVFGEEMSEFSGTLKERQEKVMTSLSHYCIFASEEVGDNIHSVIKPYIASIDRFKKFFQTNPQVMRALGCVGTNDEEYCGKY